jgi:hypothetical protein
MRSGNGLASSRPASIATVAASSATVRLVSPATAPHSAEPSAKDPSADSTCSAAARERTHGGALVCVAVLKVDITAIHAAPDAANAPYTGHATGDSADTPIASAKVSTPATMSRSSPRPLRRRPMTKLVTTAPPPRQPIIRP